MTINQAINLLASVTLFELMVAIGLGATFAEVLDVARNGRLLLRAALANYVCVPAAALGLLLWFHPVPLVAAGFLIAAVCPGAPYGPPFTRIARGNVVVSIGLMVVLAGSSALLAPLLLYWLLPLTSGNNPPEVNALKLVGTLLLAQLLPLCLGLAVRHWRPALAERLKKPADLLSLVLNLALLGVIIAVQWDMLVSISLRAYGGMLALVLAGVAAGWLLGGPGDGNRTAMTMATSVRNVGVSLVIATASFAGTEAVTATTAFALFQTVVMALVALGWRRLAVGSTEEAKLQEPWNEGVAKGVAS
jgi:BASS family bile acid:Na+ symporter